MDNEPDHGAEMRSTTEQALTANNDESFPSLRDTHRLLGLSEITQRYWQDFEFTKLPEPQKGSALEPEVRGDSHSTTRAVKQIEQIPPHVDLPEARVSFHPLQEWEGYVIAIGDTTFTARLTDLTTGADIAREEAEFPMEDLTDDDRERISMGSVFRWAVGYERRLGGTKRRISHIVFRRLPMWTKRDLAKAEEEAVVLAKSLKWE